MTKGTPAVTLRSLDRKIEKAVDQLDAKIDTAVDRLDAKIDTVVDRLDAKIDAKFEASMTHTRLLFEQNRGQMSLVAEGVAALNDKFDHFLDRHVAVENDVQLLKAVCRGLDGRVTRLEETDAPGG